MVKTTNVVTGGETQKAEQGENESVIHIESSKCIGVRFWYGDANRVLRTGAVNWLGKKLEQEGCEEFLARHGRKEVQGPEAPGEAAYSGPGI